MNSSDQNISKPVGWNYSSISAPEDSFPIRVEGRNKDSVYVDFHSQEAMLNFEKKNEQQTCRHCATVRLIPTLEKLLPKLLCFQKF